MGSIRNGANGGFSGKAGSVIGSSWRGINYIKGLPKLSTKAPSQKQLEQQAKFALAVKFLQPVKDLLNAGYGKQKQGQATGFNMALRQVLESAVTGIYPDYMIDYSAVIFSKGSLARPAGVSVLTDAGNLTISWSPQANKFNGFADDEVTVLIYNPANKIYLNGLDGVLRSEGEMTVDLPADYAGNEVHAYMFYTSRDGLKMSESTYAGSAVVI